MSSILISLKRLFNLLEMLSCLCVQSSLVADISMEPLSNKTMMMSWTNHKTDKTGYTTEIIINKSSQQRN